MTEGELEIETKKERAHPRHKRKAKLLPCMAYFQNALVSRLLPQAFKRSHAETELHERKRGEHTHNKQAQKQKHENSSNVRADRTRRCAFLRLRECWDPSALFESDPLLLMLSK